MTKLVKSANNIRNIHHLKQTKIALMSMMASKNIGTKNSGALNGKADVYKCETGSDFNKFFKSIRWKNYIRQLRIGSEQFSKDEKYTMVFKTGLPV